MNLTRLINNVNHYFLNRAFRQGRLPLPMHRLVGIITLVAIVSVNIFIMNIAPAAALSGDLHMHDPSVIKVGSCYYGFSTGFEGGPGHGSPTIRKTCDPTLAGGWTYVGTVFSNTPAWITTALGSQPPNLWAPDINFFNGKYHLYYGGSLWGTSFAVMGLATATNIEGPWTDAGEVTRVNYPIDPNVSWGPNNTLYIEWGSWTGGGINMHVLNPSTGKLSTTDHNLWHIANGIENATIAFNSPYYYLFGSRGSCCSGVNSTYYTVVARSTSITGPYLDKNGVNINSGGGTTILTGSSPKIAAGGGDAFDDGSTKRLAYHYYDANNNGRETLDIRTMTFSNGWPVLSAPLSSSSPTATPTKTSGASATLTSTRTLTPGAGPTATPTRTLGASATRTPTPGSSGSTCSPVTASIAAPFTFDGAGTFCWQSGNLGAYINSWNAASVTVNGLDVTNIYVAAGGLPARVNGFWYVSYTSNVAWGHFEAR